MNDKHYETDRNMQSVEIDGSFTINDSFSTIRNSKLTKKISAIDSSAFKPVTIEEYQHIPAHSQRKTDLMRKLTKNLQKSMLLYLNKGSKIKNTNDRKKSRKLLRHDIKLQDRLNSKEIELNELNKMIQKKSIVTFASTERDTLHLGNAQASKEESELFSKKILRLKSGKFRTASGSQNLTLSKELLVEKTKNMSTNHLDDIKKEEPLKIIEDSAKVLDTVVVQASGKLRKDIGVSKTAKIKKYVNLQAQSFQVFLDNSRFSKNFDVISNSSGSSNSVIGILRSGSISKTEKIENISVMEVVDYEKLSEIKLKYTKAGSLNFSEASLNEHDRKIRPSNWIRKLKRGESSSLGIFDDDIYLLCKEKIDDIKENILAVDNLNSWITNDYAPNKQISSGKIKKHDDHLKRLTNNLMKQGEALEWEADGGDDEKYLEDLKEEKQYRYLNSSMEYLQKKVDIQLDKETKAGLRKEKFESTYFEWLAVTLKLIIDTNYFISEPAQKTDISCQVPYNFTKSQLDKHFEFLSAFHMGHMANINNVKSASLTKHFSKASSNLKDSKPIKRRVREKIRQEGLTSDLEFVYQSYNFRRMDFIKTEAELSGDEEQVKLSNGKLILGYFINSQ